VRDEGTELLMAHDSDVSRPDGAIDLDVSWLVAADLRSVDALARLQVVASRRGRRLQLHGAAEGLVALLEFVGLDDVVRVCPLCATKPGREEGRTP
jgi:ABC-type transporter Mla MlaB component